MCQDQDYVKTLNLPETSFPMRGGLQDREPQMVSSWQEDKIYNKMVDKNKGKKSYILHDGPPYANGDIHLGTALNKVLKDIIIKYKNMTGYYAPYVPGWDTHGLPIELKAIKELGISNIDNHVEVREKCKQFALSCVDIQKDQFIRLGILGDFDNPYLTLHKDFEARQIEIFGHMAKKGYIYKGLKPVYWCADCHTALAEAEIEYAEDPCFSIYVKFYVEKDNGVFSNLNIDPTKVSFVIWTTTTWTLPGNVAICIGKDFEYSIVKVDDEFLVIAKDLVDEVLRINSIENHEVIATIKGSDLELIETKHPFIDRKSLVILGDHVTLESGTGCVHTAPGHGVDDYEVIVKHYNHLPLVVPVDNKGYLTEEAAQFEGLNVINNEAGRAIAKYLDENGYLFGTKKIKHQYPHCWRCKNPIIFRATEQWFCSVENFREKALEAIEDVKWIPSWGEDRISSMVRDRSDWCISRQRTWGVPIPIFYCEDCGKAHIDDDSIKSVADKFKRYGSNSWYEMSASEILESGTKCKDCGSSSFRKETDIMDVWFDSGVSHGGVLDLRENLSWPADLYLEGNDQYRGWFQSSLLTSVAWREKAPYKTVCTHGWVVDGKGKKMSKSIGNGINPNDIIKEY
ncbi:MAG: isoleucine--tRNA ligase, partial [Oscillospiraceae bacterium]